MQRIKSFDELGAWMDDHSFEIFKSMNPREKKQFLLGKGIDLKNTFNGKYIKEKQVVLINDKYNPFTKGPLYAELLSNDLFKDNENIKVFLKYDADNNSTPENIFKCESFNSLKSDFYIVEAITKPTGDVGLTAQFLILDYYLKYGVGKVFSEKRFFDLTRLLHKHPNVVQTEIKKYDTVIRNCNEGYTGLASINKKIVEMYELFHDDIDSYNEKIAGYYKIVSEERKKDIIDSWKINKNGDPRFDENSIKVFRINVDKETIRLIKSRNKFFFNPEQLMQKESKEYCLVPSKIKASFFCSIPPKRVCNLYVKDEKTLTISFSDTTIYEQRNGALIRNVRIIEDFSKKKRTAKENIVELKNKEKFEKQKINHYVEVKVTDSKRNLEKVKNNPYVKKLRETKNRISLTNNNYYSAFDCFDRTGAIRELQLIRGMHNHVTLGHEIENKVATIAYYDEYEGFTDIKILLHYCKRCKRYFDFYDSFLLQLRENNIKKASLIITYLDDQLNPFVFDEISLREHSKLNLFGYSVGYSGLNKMERQALLYRIINNKYMSAAEVKNHLEFLIMFNGQAKGKEYAKLCWQEDIEYINVIEKERLD